MGSMAETTLTNWITKTGKHWIQYIAERPMGSMGAIAATNWIN